VVLHVTVATVEGLFGTASTPPITTLVRLMFSNYGSRMHELAVGQYSVSLVALRLWNLRQHHRSAR